MSNLKYRRKLNEDWVFDDFIARDRAGARQSILGQTLNARLLTVDNVVVWQETGGAGVTITETGAPNAGEFTYRRTVSNLIGVVAGGNYKLDFGSTIGGVPVTFPEDGSVIVEALA